MAQKCSLLLLIFWNVSSTSPVENFIDKEQLSKAGSTTCEEGRYVLNKCEERCECRDGKPVNCYRVSKDFSKMDIHQRRHFLNTYKVASTHPVFQNDYKKVVAYHIDTPDRLLHHSHLIFLPWHRWWLVTFENLLRRIDCRVNIPYWDWSQVSHHWRKGSGNEDIWNPGDHGLCGDGNPFNYFCVEDGPFSKDR